MPNKEIETIQKNSLSKCQEVVCCILFHISTFLCWILPRTAILTCPRLMSLSTTCFNVVHCPHFFITIFLHRHFHQRLYTISTSAKHHATWRHHKRCVRVSTVFFHVHIGVAVVGISLKVRIYSPTQCFRGRPNLTIPQVFMFSSLHQTMQICSVAPQSMANALRGFMYSLVASQST